MAVSHAHTKVPFKAKHRVVPEIIFLISTLAELLAIHIYLVITGFVPTVDDLEDRREAIMVRCRPAKFPGNIGRRRIVSAPDVVWIGEKLLEYLPLTQGLRAGFLGVGAAGEFRRWARRLRNT